MLFYSMELQRFEGGKPFLTEGKEGIRAHALRRYSKIIDKGMLEADDTARKAIREELKGMCRQKEIPLNRELAAELVKKYNLKYEFAKDAPLSIDEFIDVMLPVSAEMPQGTMLN